MAPKALSARARPPCRLHPSWCGWRQARYECSCRCVHTRQVGAIELGLPHLALGEAPLSQVLGRARAGGGAIHTAAGAIVSGEWAALRHAPSCRCRGRCQRTLSKTGPHWQVQQRRPSSEPLTTLPRRRPPPGPTGPGSSGSCRSRRHPRLQVPRAVRPSRARAAPQLMPARRQRLPASPAAAAAAPAAACWQPHCAVGGLAAGPRCARPGVGVRPEQGRQPQGGCGRSPPARRGVEERQGAAFSSRAQTCATHCSYDCRRRAPMPVLRWRPFGQELRVADGAPRGVPRRPPHWRGCGANGGPRQCRAHFRRASKQLRGAGRGCLLTGAEPEIIVRSGGRQCACLL